MIPGGSVDCAHTLEVAEDYYGKGDRRTARELLQSIVTTDVAVDDGDSIRAKEQAVYRLAELLTVTKDGEAAIQLLSDVRPFFQVLPKAKTTKMVRKLFEHIVQCGVPLKQQEAICLETVDWARKERRTFLRHRLQLRYVEILFAENRKNDALASLSALLKEVRRLDDRTLLLDIYLLESKLYYAVMDIQKARAALVSARTTANSIYCPPLSQAEIDLQSGVLHADEKDNKTAYSYLYEAFEGFHQLGDQARQARRSLRYMILSKISTDSPDELATLLSSKSVLEYKGADVDALRGIADAYNKQDTHLFNSILAKCRTEAEESGAGGGSDTNLLADEVVRRQVNDMYNTLLERHILKVVSPYNRVQIAYVSSLLKLDAMVVEQKLSQLILDRKLRGIVDQQHRCLILFDDEAAEASKPDKDGGEDFYDNAADAAAAADQAPTTLYQDALTALECYNTLVTALFDKINGKFDALVEENIAKHRGAKAKENEDEANRKNKRGGISSTKDAAADRSGKNDKSDSGNKPTRSGDKRR
ncbi:proteasome regulatory non-ATPase subunit 6, putative [Leishmania panamensis]|uniref:Probable 26S proteasome regulatory subunit rpn-6.2 n=1 Tax=Leishmania panamensis TaxID=5679 RepID=A0A088RH76_LEIPA|nr:proteasome regulatory non-ATPase subunit 6, putative [Leishmania panamensis]AIN95208.1 proteasome regulatory non-ATPase subunit 6, putative [Leishmania panamensis]